MTAELLAGVIVVLFTAVSALGLRESRRRHRDKVLLQLLSAFGPAVAEGKANPERLVAWAQVAQTARSLFPEALARLDAAAGGRFPFSPEVIEAAHARWTADWLAWERQHDLEYKRRASEAEAAAERAGEQPMRVRLAAITQEKLQTYQDRYEHYVRVGKAISALGETETRE